MGFVVVVVFFLGGGGGGGQSLSLRSHSIKF